MKIKHIIAVLCCLAAAAFVLGVTGVIDLRPSEPLRSVEECPRLIGVLITRQPLFTDDLRIDEEAAAHPTYSRSAVLENGVRRYYATLKTSSEKDESGREYPVDSFVFEGVSGLPFFVPTRLSGLHSGHPVSQQIDPAIFAQSLHVWGVEKSVSPVSLDGVLHLNRELFFVPENADAADRLLFFNPVFATPSGEVYAEAAMGEVLSSYESTVTVEYHETCNLFEPTPIRTTSFLTKCSGSSVSFTPDRSGEPGSESDIPLSEVSVTLKFRYPTALAIINHYGTDGALIRREEYASSDIPDEIAAAPGAVSVVVELVETVRPGEQTAERVLLTPNNEKPSFFTSYRDGEDGTVHTHRTVVKWQ